MAVTFRFQSVPSKLFGTRSRPIAVVDFKHRLEDYWLPVQMIVDTGADYSVLPRAFALPLGIDLRRDCRAHETIGIGGSEKIFLYRGQPVRMGKYVRTIPIGFLNRDTGPALLGRHEFFETFKVIFHNRRAQFFNPRRRKQDAH